MSKKPRSNKQIAIQRRQYKSTVHEQPSQVRTMQEHKAHLREAAIRSAENARDDIRQSIQGGDPFVRNVRQDVKTFGERLLTRCTERN